MKRVVGLRASPATQPEGHYAPPKAANFCPSASLRAACGARTTGTTRAYPTGKILAVKWANINEIWYCPGAVTRVAAPVFFECQRNL